MTISIISTHSGPSFHRSFSFKKKSISGTTKVDVPFKLLQSNVLTKRSVNITSPTIPNKPEISNPNINSFFAVNTKTKVDSPNITARKLPSTVTQVIPDTPQDKPSSGNRSNQVDLAASFVFPEDDWDDFNDFETPVKVKSSLETSGRTEKKCSNKNDELKKTSHNDAECSIITAAIGDRTKTSPKHNELRETNSPDLWGPEDSPVKMPQRRPKTGRTLVLSDDEEDAAGVTPVQEVTGNYYPISCSTVQSFQKNAAFFCYCCG